MKSKKPEPTFEEWYDMDKPDGDKMSPVEYENNLPQKIRIDRVVEGYGRSWDGRYEGKVIYFDKGKLKEGIVSDEVVKYLVSKIQEYKIGDKK